MLKKINQPCHLFPTQTASRISGWIYFIFGRQCACWNKMNKWPMSCISPELMLLSLLMFKPFKLITSVLLHYCQTENWEGGQDVSHQIRRRPTPEYSSTLFRTVNECFLVQTINHSPVWERTGSAAKTCFDLLSYIHAHILKQAIEICVLVHRVNWSYL